jgi:hypothetical protein
LEQVLETGLRHPAGASKMALPNQARTSGLPRRIDAQKNSRNFLPVDTLSLGVEQA